MSTIFCKTTVTEQMHDIVKYANPSLSLCVFFAWMHCVFVNSMAYVPVYFVAGIVLLLLRNYYKYGGEKFNAGFAPITLFELVNVMLYGGPGTKHIKPIAVSSQSELTFDDAWTASDFGVGGYKLDGDHMEFPFSEARRHAKKSLSEACVDASAMFLEDNKHAESSSTLFRREWRHLSFAIHFHSPFDT